MLPYIAAPWILYKMPGKHVNLYFFIICFCTNRFCFTIIIFKIIPINIYKSLIPIHCMLKIPGWCFGTMEFYFHIWDTLW